MIKETVTKKKKVTAKKAQSKVAGKAEQRVTEIKARMFDLMVHRDSVNNQISAELKSLNKEMQSLTS